MIAWDPVLEGASHLAALRGMQRTYERATQRLRGLRELPEARDIAVAGLRLAPAAARELTALSLPRSLAAPLTWVVTSAGARQAAAFATLDGAAHGWSQLTVDTDAYGWDDVARWDDVPRRRGVGGADPRRPGGAMIERACQLGAHRHLVGVMTLPAGQVRRALVLVSAGLVPKAGPYRLYVELARRLAADGVATLRFDLDGLGDSAATGAGALRERTARDVAAAVDHVRAHAAAPDLIVGGLCSGAEDAFRHAAIDPRVTGTILIDPFSYPTAGFAWRHARHRLGRRALRALGRYQPFAVRPRTDAALVDYAYIPQPEARAILAALIARDATSHFVYTGGALETFNHPGQLAAMFPDLDLRRHATVDHLPQMEHTQALAADRAALIEAIAARLAARR
ncbi:MAG: alpha/beta hydrolase [Kofleriaceae bacterium]